MHTMYIASEESALRSTSYNIYGYMHAINSAREASVLMSPADNRKEPGVRVGFKGPAGKKFEKP